MQQRTLDEFVDYLRRRRVLGYRPPVLLLGAGASFEAGIGTMKQLFEFTGAKDFDAFVQYISRRSADERYIHLSEFLQTHAPAEVTPGYRALAALLAETYFDLVLSTNFDPLLEDALANARLWRKDFMLLVNGIVRPERLDLILREPSPRVKIIKLHGDLFHRYMAWTPDEMEAFVKEIRPPLRKVLWGRDILIVGYSMSDRPIRELVVKAGGPESTIWYLHFAEVAKPLRRNPRVRGVVDPACRFEQLFPYLAQALGVEAAALASPVRRRRGGGAAVATGSDRTLDDLMASVVGLLPAEHEDGPPICTGFLLSEPRVIVTDGYARRTFSEFATVVTHDGRRLSTRLLRIDASHPLGPVVFQAPAELRAPGMRLDNGTILPGLAVRVGVAAGERVGISSGSVTQLETGIEVKPVGWVKHLALIDAGIAPGSAGAPVVDAATLAVRGYIVARGLDESRAWMYPAYHWAPVVREPASRPG